MLLDKVRTDTYKSFILNNPSLFANKTVLEVGCGTGILSIFCAQAGASHVFAVDNSDIIVKAKEIIEKNGFSHVISTHKCRIEDFSLPPGCPHVDTIVSEWMGYFLFYENMLPSVLYARDNFLNPEGGAIVPDKAVLYAHGYSDSTYKKEKLEFWDNLYGVDMSPMKSLVEKEVSCREQLARLRSDIFATISVFLFFIYFHGSMTLDRQTHRLE